MTRKHYVFRVKEECDAFGIDNIKEYQGKVFTFCKLLDVYLEDGIDTDIDIDNVQNTYMLACDDGHNWWFDFSQFEEVKLRGFEIVKDEFRKNPDKEILLPERSTKFSAGYDFCNNSGEEIRIYAGEQVVFVTDVKAYMQESEVLKIYIRSSLGIKKGLVLSNGVAVIDHDYYENESTDGNIMIAIRNISNDLVIIKPYEKIAQGIFERYYIIDNDNAEGERVGGVGSTG